jgi:hypothetical protein
MNDSTSAAHRTADALMKAVTAASHAPSILNTQPWRWRVRADGLELFAERSRQLPAGDPDGRLLTVSCGAALHHARITLAAAGWTVHVARLPDPAQPDLLARLTLAGQVGPTAAAVRQAQAIPDRRTDRRSVSEQTVAVSTLDDIVAAADAGARLQILTPSQALGVASAAAHAAAVEAADSSIVAELTYWTGRLVPEGTGIPPGVMLDQPPPTTVPASYFGRRGTLPAGAGHDRAAVYALLYGDGDEPADWLRGGEGLSAVWLTATSLGVSLVPLSAVTALTSTRATIRGLLADVGYPYLVLRLGIAASVPAGMARTPRLAAAQLIDPSPRELTAHSQ